MSKASAMAADVQVEVIDPVPTLILDCTDVATAEVVVVVEFDTVLEANVVFEVVVVMDMTIEVGVVVEIMATENRVFPVTEISKLYPFVALGCYCGHNVIDQTLRFDAIQCSTLNLILLCLCQYVNRMKKN